MVENSASYIIDIEADSLTPTKIWCIVLQRVETNEEIVLSQQDTMGDDLRNILDGAVRIIGHNIVDFDLPCIRKLLGVHVPSSCVWDTLVLSRLLDAGRAGGHSLDNWGTILKHPKLAFKDFSCLSDEMVRYCVNDVRLNRKVYDYQMKIINRNPGKFDRAIKVEHDMAYICREMQDNGFKYNYEEAERIDKELESKLEGLHRSIQSSFLPRTRLIKEITPKATKFGTISRVNFKWYEGEDFSQFSVGSPFSLFEWVPFNPGSPKQVVERLWEAGWKPKEKTKTHIEHEKEGTLTDEHKKYGWKINEVNISTLPENAPAGCKYLVEHLLLSARRRTLAEWREAYNAGDQRIHGKFLHIGTRTHRMSHSSPNMGNIATKKSIKYNSEHLRALALDYGGRMRSLWTCEEDSWLVGCDMEAAHLRIFAHLINDKEFIHALVAGRKEDGTDPHSVNMRKLGPSCKDRDRAKTFIFTFLNGGRAGKVKEILGCARQEAEVTLENFIASYPGLVALRERTIPRDARRGYFEGLDGRLVVNDSEHHMIGMYLQNAEAVVMKHANVLWRAKLDEAHIPYRQVNFVHDEFVTEVQGPRELAEEVGRIQSDSIRSVGASLGLLCPLAGEWKIGKTWLDVH